MTRSLLAGVPALGLAFLANCAPPTGESPVAPAAARVAASSAAPTVTTFTPKEGKQGTTLDLSVTGTGYDGSSGVTLLLNGKATGKVKTNSTTLISSTDLIANITIAADAVIADYDVQVVNAGGKKGIGIEKFAVLQQGPPGQWDPPQLSVAFGQGSTGTDALRGDDAANSIYPTGEAHVAVNGNLIFWLGSGHPRSVSVTTTAFTGSTRDRLYTNTHDNPGGNSSFGLLGMVAGSTGTAVLEAELNVQDSDPLAVVRYGKDCKGAANAANRVVTTRSLDGRTWTVTGTSGIQCQQQGKKPGLSPVGTAGPFSITLVWP